jgi:ketosteroid isomerase-like protein
MAQTEESNKTLVEEFLQSSTRDPSRIGDYLSEDLTWTLPFDPAFTPFAGTLTKAQLLSQFASFAQIMPDGLHYTVKNLTAEGNRVACEAESSANSALGPFSNRYHFLFELRDGKIFAAREYCDSAFIAAFAARAARQ